MERASNEAQERKAFFQHAFRGSLSRTAGASSVGNFLRSMANAPQPSQEPTSKQDNASSIMDRNAAAGCKSTLS